MSDLQQLIDEVVAARDFGTATARKSRRGARTGQWPWVPVIRTVRADTGMVHHLNPTRGRAFATREEAVAAAQAIIDRSRRDLAEKLANPRFRALREQHGLPREIPRVPA